MNEFFVSIPYIGGYVAGNMWAEVIIVIAVTVIMAQLMQYVIIATLRRLTQHTDTNIDDRVITALERPLFYTVILLGIITTVSLSGISMSVQHVVASIAQTMLIFLWARFFFQLIRAVLYKSKDAPNISIVQEQTLPLFENALGIVIVASSIYAIFTVWGINMTAWIASAGIVGMAIGFAAKDTLANLFSGVFILADAPYKIGDYIELDSGERGEVTHIGIRSTRMLTRGDVEVTIPNAVIGNAKIVNESGGPSQKFRVQVNVGVAYGSDIDLVEKELLAAATEVKLAESEPIPRARFVAFGDSSLDYSLYYWVAHPSDRGLSRHLVNRAIYKRFNNANIDIPFPQREILLKK